MSIAWLWHYTHAADPDALRRFNEQRAAAFHARSRNAFRRAARLGRRLRGTISRWHERRRKRALRRELERLPEGVLKDIGWPALDRPDHADTSNRRRPAHERSFAVGGSRGAAAAPDGASSAPSSVPLAPSPSASPLVPRAACRAEGARPDARRRDAVARPISGCAAPARRRARSASRRASTPRR